MAKLLVARTQTPCKVQGVENPDDPDHNLNVSGGLLPGSEIAGPTFAQWLDAYITARASARA